MDSDMKDSMFPAPAYEKGIADEDANVTGTLFSSTVNLANTILGSGMLAMPFVFANLGIAQGMVLLTITAILSVFGLGLLTQMANTLNSRDVSFNAICMTAYPAAAAVMDFAIALLCFGAGVSYHIIGMFLFYLSRHSWDSSYHNHWKLELPSLGYDWRCSGRPHLVFKTIGLAKVCFLPFSRRHALPCWTFCLLRISVAGRNGRGHKRGIRANRI
jgi:hypothetical protein